MAFCINCGANNSDASIFCLECGHRIYHEAELSPAVTGKRRFPTAAIVSLALICLAVIGTLIRAGVHRPQQVSVMPSLDPASSGRKALPVSAVLTIFSKHADGTSFAQGSGFLLTPDGLAASNYHVLNGAALATAECCNGRTFDV